ncbi:MAG: MFS transporter [Anaerolineae bacterium]|nr:MFS transporter [Anaerolineae bacterium]
MPVSNKTRTLRLCLFAVIYFLQGGVMTYLSAFNTLYLRSFDISFSLIGIVAGIAMIPFILKIFIGLLSDRVNLFNRGHRKPYIILGILLQSLAFLLLTVCKPDSQFGLYIGAMVLVALGMSTYDTTTDGLSIDTTSRQDRGLVQGLMVGGRAISVVITAVLMGIFAHAGNWNAIFYMVSALGLLALVFAFLVEENKERPAETEFSGAAFSAFKDKSLLLFILMGFVYPLALYSTEGMISPYLNEALGVSLEQVGLYTGVYGIGTFFGALFGGPLMKRIKERASLISALVITTLVTLLLAVAPSAAFMWVVVFLFGVAFGFYSTAYFAMGMEFSDPRIAAFMFSVIMAVGNFAIAAGSALAGGLVDAVGFRPMFFIFAAVHVCVLPIIFGVFKFHRQKSAAAV